MKVLMDQQRNDGMRERDRDRNYFIKVTELFAKD